MRLLKIPFFLFSYVCCFAQQTVVLNNNTTEFIFKNQFLEILEDTSKQLSINDVSSTIYRDKFILNNSEYPYNEHLESAYWIRFKVVNKADHDHHFLLESYAPHTNSWDLYIPDGKEFILKRSGIDLYFYDREYVNKNLILNLPATDSVQTFYVRVLSSNHSSFDYRIKSASYFFFYSVNEYYFLGMFYGILIIMAIYNLLMYVFLLERVYLYYVFYVLCGILTTLADDGIGYQYIWTNSPGINSYIGSQIAPSLLLIAFVLYSRDFLRLRRTHPFYDRIVIGTTLFYFFYYGLKLIILPPYLHFHGFYLIPFLLVYIIGIKIYMTGYKPARFMIIGFGFILCSIIIIKLRSNGSIEGNLFTVYSFNYGLILEVLVLSFSLAERVRFDKKTREKALLERNNAQFEVIRQMRVNKELQENINRELEIKVDERTRELHEKNKELEETNLKLKEMTEKANQMSIKLDLDNWNLQKKVMESMKERMFGQEISYEEFSKLFPDETSCFRYLYELKWSNGYECIKCKCTENTADEKLFVKKCSRCGYSESVTANTLFHALKFPVNKAFYILYLTIYQPDHHTLSELSQLLDLNLNTVWKFKQKVISVIEIQKKKKRSKTETSNTWENIILLSA